MRDLGDWYKRARYERVLHNTGYEGVCRGCHHTNPLFPTFVELCYGCAMKLSYGSRPFIPTQQKIPVGSCDWCGERRVNLRQFNIYFCQSCLNRVAVVVNGARRFARKIA